MWLAGPNMLVNPDFETGVVSFWAATGVGSFFVMFGGTPASGSYYALHNVSSWQAHRITQSIQVNVSSGLYLVEAALRQGAAASYSRIVLRTVGAIIWQSSTYAFNVPTNWNTIREVASLYGVYTPPNSPLRFEAFRPNDITGYHYDDLALRPLFYIDTVGYDFNIEVAANNRYYIRGVAGAIDYFGGSAVARTITLPLDFVSTSFAVVVQSWWLSLGIIRLYPGESVLTSSYYQCVLAGDKSPVLTLNADKPGYCALTLELSVL